METADREQLLRFLNASRKKLIESTEGLTDEQVKMRPAEDRWSVLECVEHTALVEDGMFNTLTTKMVPADVAHDRTREPQFIRGTTDRSRKIDAPDGVRPAGEFATLADALARFENSRARTIDYISKLDLDLRRANHYASQARYAQRPGIRDYSGIASGPPRTANPRHT